MTARRALVFFFDPGEQETAEALADRLFRRAYSTVTGPATVADPERRGFLRAVISLPDDAQFLLDGNPAAVTAEDSPTRKGTGS